MDKDLLILIKVFSHNSPATIKIIFLKKKITSPAWLLGSPFPPRSQPPRQSLYLKIKFSKRVTLGIEATGVVRLINTYCASIIQSILGDKEKPTNSNKTCVLQNILYKVSSTVQSYASRKHSND